MEDKQEMAKDTPEGNQIAKVALEMEGDVFKGNQIAKIPPEMGEGASGLNKIAKMGEEASNLMIVEVPLEMEAATSEMKKITMVPPEMEAATSEEDKIAKAIAKLDKEKKMTKLTPCKRFISWRHVPHVFHGAVVGAVHPSSLLEIEGLDIELMRRQHQALVRTLRELNLRVIELYNLQGSFRTSLLLENIAISCHGIVFLTRPETAEHKSVVKELHYVFKRDLSQVVFQQVSKRSRVCGADVLFTGQEVLVGIGETTNERGAHELSEAFTDFPVTPIKMPDGADHLKNYVTVVGDNYLGVGSSDLAKEVMESIKQSASHTYKVLELAEEDAANCLYLNQTLVHKAIEEIPESFKIFMNWSRNPRRSICFSEFSRLNRGLTSACILTKQLL